MTISNFSNGFDTLLNSYASKTVPGDQASRAEVHLDEYEKSFFLTKAQDEIVIELYSGKNAYGDSFENTEETRRYLSNLIAEDRLDPITTSSGMPLGVDSKSKFFTLPENLWFITYEAVILEADRCGNEHAYMDVVPVTQDEYHRVKRNPFRGPNNRRALRLDLSEGVIEIVCKYPVESYYVRYMRKARPIILTDLKGTDLSIDGVRGTQDNYNPCELHEALHQRILERAVTLALRSKGYNIDNNK